MITIRVTGPASWNVPAVERTAAALENPQALLKVLGTAVAETMRGHFLDRDAEPNRKGWPKQHFWKDIADATVRGEPAAGRIEVIVADRRFNLKVFGGTVRPVEARALAIPVNRIAYGVRPRVLQDQLGVPIFRPRKSDGVGAGFLAARIEGEFVVLYSLVRSARHDPDQRAMPPAETVWQAITDGLDDHLAALAASN